MLIPTMTNKEIYDNIAKDYHNKIKIKQDFLRSKAIREFKKELKFPAWRWYEYTIPESNNKYIIFFYAESRAVMEKPHVDFYAVVYDSKGRYIIQAYPTGYRHTEESPFQLIRQVSIYSRHFFERYNERIWKDKTIDSNEIVCRYLTRNKIGMPIEMNEQINRRLEAYGDSAKYGYRVRDGFCFARSGIDGVMSEDGDRSKDKVESMLVQYATFMNETDMSDTQLTAINREHYISWLRCVQDFQKEAVDGVITLTLEP